MAQNDSSPESTQQKPIVEIWQIKAGYVARIKGSPIVAAAKTRRSAVWLAGVDLVVDGERLGQRLRHGDKNTYFTVCEIPDPNVKS